MQIRRSLAAGALSVIALSGFAAAPANAGTTSDVTVDAATCTAMSDAVAPAKASFLEAQKAFNARKAAVAKQAKSDRTTTREAARKAKADTKSARKAAKPDTKTARKATKADGTSAKGSHGKAADAHGKTTHGKSADAHARLMELKGNANKLKSEWQDAKAAWSKAKKACGSLEGSGSTTEPTEPTEPTTPAVA